MTLSSVVLGLAVYACPSSPTRGESVVLWPGCSLPEAVLAYPLTHADDDAELSIAAVRAARAARECSVELDGLASESAPTWAIVAVGTAAGLVLGVLAGLEL